MNIISTNILYPCKINFEDTKPLLTLILHGQLRLKLLTFFKSFKVEGKSFCY